MRVKLSDVKISKLNGTCLSLIAKFSRELKAHDGTVLPLTSPDVVKQVLYYARRTRNPELRKLGNSLVREIRELLVGEGAAVVEFSAYKNLDSAHVEETSTAEYRF
jgi:hypothetical protein